jgi:hypothetical protein
MELGDYPMMGRMLARHLEPAEFEHLCLPSGDLTAGRFPIRRVRFGAARLRRLQTTNAFTECADYVWLVSHALGCHE